MKAIVYHRYGTPDVMGVEAVQRPTPGDREVLVKVRAVSINAWDWDMLTGKPWEYRLLSGLLKPKSTLLHGCDIAGRIEALGPGVTAFRVGDEVFGDLAEDGWGAFAEFACASESSLTLKPSGVSFPEAACLSHGGNLAVQGLIDVGGIKAGQRVLINGGGGSTGTLAIQIAKVFDVEVTGVDRRGKLGFMRRLGADHVMDYAEADFTRQHQRFDLIFDVKTDRSFFDYGRALAPNGTYVTVGGKTSRILQILCLGRTMKKKRMRVVAYTANKDTGYLLAQLSAGNIKPVIDKCFPLEKTADAFRYYGEGRFRGKVVVTMGEGMGL